VPGHSTFSIGKFRYSGPFAAAVALVAGIVLGGSLLTFAVYSNKPAPVIGFLANNAVATLIASTPTPTPPPTPTPVIVQLVETVEVVQEVEITREVEVEKLVVVTVEVERQVEVEKEVTVYVEVTPSPLSVPDILESRMSIAFQEAGEYLMTGNPDSLSSIWAGRDGLYAEVDRLVNVFSGVTFVDWVVEDSEILKKEEPYEVYTLGVGSTLTITGYYICGGQRVKDTLDIAYPGLVRAEVQNPDLGVVRIYSWTNSRLKSVSLELCATPVP
jgi:hypothetical protein